MSKLITLGVGVGLAVCSTSCANAQLPLLGLLGEGLAARAAVGMAARVAAGSAARSVAMGEARMLAGTVVGRGGQAFIRNPRANYYNFAPSVHLPSASARPYGLSNYLQSYGSAPSAYYPQSTCTVRVQHCPVPGGYVQRVIRVCN